MTDLDPLRSDEKAIVYFDIKSPYAYLAVAPTRALERELGMSFDWRPFVLDIPSYLGSARLGADGQVVEQQRSESQWAGVKYAYFDCRRYARLWGISIRGTEKIWDTNLISTAMWWLRARSGDRVAAFLDRVYAPFWSRELDVENEQVVVALLDEQGEDGGGFLDWARDEGLAFNRQFQEQAFAAGIYGVPTYVVGGQRYFGREHLPRVRWHLTGEEGAPPDISYPLPQSTFTAPTSSPTLVIAVDDSLDSLLAIPRLAGLAADFAGDTRWCRRPNAKAVTSPDTTDYSRGAQHQRNRAVDRQLIWERYAPGELLPADVRPAIDRILDEFSIALDPLPEAAPDDLAMPPLPGVAVRVDGELFVGRQHLPLLVERLL